jgi:serine/threonine protein kinase
VQQAWNKAITVQANDRNDNPSWFNFRYLEVIGNGTFGIVCRARDLDTGNIIAIKTVFQDQDHQSKTPLKLFLFLL